MSCLKAAASGRQRQQGCAAGLWCVLFMMLASLAPPACPAEFIEFVQHDKRKPKHTGFFISRVSWWCCTGGVHSRPPGMGPTALWRHLLRSACMAWGPANAQFALPVCLCAACRARLSAPRRCCRALRIWTRRRARRAAVVESARRRRMWRGQREPCLPRWAAAASLLVARRIFSACLLPAAPNVSAAVLCLPCRRPRQQGRRRSGSRMGRTARVARAPTSQPRRRRRLCQRRWEALQQRQYRCPGPSCPLRSRLGWLDRWRREAWHLQPRQPLAAAACCRSARARSRRHLPRRRVRLLGVRSACLPWQQRMRAACLHLILAGKPTPKPAHHHPACPARSALRDAR